MKDTRSNEIKAAIFLVIAAAIMVTLSLRVSGTLDLLTRETYVVNARFESVLGIAPMTKVTLNGVRVGRVRDMRLIDPDARGARAELVLELDRNRAVLYEGASAMITADTLLAVKHIDLRSGPEKPGAKLVDGAIIYGVPSVDLEAVLQRVERVVASLETLLTDEEFLASVRGIFTEANRLILELRGLSSAAREILEDNRENVGSVVDNFNASSKNLLLFSDRLNELTVTFQEDVHRLLGSADSLISENRPEIQKLTRELAALAEDLSARIDPLLEETQKLVTQINETVGENRGELRSLLRNVEQTAGHLKEFSRQIEDHPWALVYPAPKERDVKLLLPAWQPASATDRLEQLDARWNDPGIENE